MRGLKFRLSLFLKHKKLILLNFIFLAYMNFIILNNKNEPYNITFYFNFTFKLIGYYLLISLINGFIIGNIEINNKCKDIFRTIEDAKKLVINQKLYIAFFISFLVWLLEILVLLTIALYHKEDLSTISGQFTSTLIFILFPIVIATIIGVFIGDNLKKEKAYSLITIVWIFITPLNEFFYNTISNYFKLPTLRWNLTLGSIYMNSFDGILGSHIYDYEIAKLAIFLTILLSIYNVYYINNKKKVYIICSIILIASLYIINSNKYNISDAMMIQRTGEFYSTEAKLDLKSKNIFDNYNIENYTIDIYPKNKAKFDVNLKIKSNEDTNFLSLILYKGFDITSLKDIKGNDLKFERDEDFLNIKLNNKLEKDKELFLNLSYEGYSGKEFFINNKGANLNSRFPYIPSNKINKVMDTSGFSSFFDLSVKSNYEVTIHDNKTFYSNLDEVKKNTFKGKADGLFLLSGNNINSYEQDGVNYYNGFLYRSYSDNPKEIEKVKNIYQNSLDWINEFLYEKEKEKIKKIFTLYHNDISTTDIFNDTILSYSEINTNLTEVDFIRDILLQKLSPPNNENGEKLMIINIIFKESLEYFINNTPLTNTKIEMLSNESHKKSYESYLEILKNLEDQDKKTFFREFFNLCLGDVTFDTFNEFLKKYN